MESLIHKKLKKFFKLSIPTREGFSFINKRSICYIESDNSYSTLFIEDGTQIVSTKSIKQFEKELEEEAFFRVHQSFIVNINKVEKFVKADNGYVVLEDGKWIKVSRSKKEDLIQFFRM